MTQIMSKQELATVVKRLFSEQMPFNQLLGFEISQLTEEYAEIQLPWNNKLMGNPLQQILHGGVTAAILDTVGGLLAYYYSIKDMQLASPEALADIKGSFGTIDMRVDYLRPGRGSAFTATAEVIRKGNKVAVCRMELHNEQNSHIAFGTGTYMVG